MKHLMKYSVFNIDIFDTFLFVCLCCLRELVCESLFARALANKQKKFSNFFFSIFFISLMSIKKKKLWLNFVCCCLFHSHTFLQLLRLLHVECSSLLSLFSHTSTFLFSVVSTAVIIFDRYQEGCGACPSGERTNGWFLLALRERSL